MRLHRPRPLTTRPTATVVIPCYNYGHYLPAAVSSALAQSGVDVEVIIVDDCSTDDSADVARALADGDPRVTVLVHEVNAGHIQTYNDGLAKATGDYVVLLSADDWLMPDSLSRATALMEAHPGVAMTYGYAADFNETPPEQVSTPLTWTTWTGPDWIRTVCARGRNLIVNPEVVLRGTVMRDIVGYRSDHPHAGDLEVWLRAAARGGVGRVNGPVQAGYRVHGVNMHVTDFSGALAALSAVDRVFDDFFDAGDGVRLADAGKYRALARRAVALEATRAIGSGRVDPQERRELESFAMDRWPGIADTLAWRINLVEPARRGPAVSRLVAGIDAVRWKLRSHRWRRLGI